MTAFSNNNIKTSAAKAKKPIRKRRPRRELPEDLTPFYIADGESPSTLDVVGGRGGVSNNHEGNKRYWRHILAERPGYKQLGKNDNAKKNEIAQAIYDYILSTGGRFLQLDSKTQKWFNLPQKIGLDKIKQALRDKYVPHSLEGECEMAAPLPTPSVPTEGDKKQFSAFLKQASTPSIDLDSIFGHGGLDMFKSGDFLNLISKPSSNGIEDLWTRFPTQNENIIQSIGLTLRGHSLDNLMRGALIASCDNMPQLKSTAPQPETSLQALLQRQMESAIPSSKTFVPV